VARHGQLAVSGLFVVVGSALEVSRRVAPVPAQRSTVVMIMGTGDRTTPYDGGPLIRHGLTGLVRKRRAVRHGERAQRVADAAAFSSAGSGSQPACDQTTFPAAETSTSHGWSCTP
jgi:hypothetical protein